MNTRIFTNEHPNTLFDKFRRILKANTTIHEFDILVGYFRASGYFKVRPFLENIPQIRILVGINVDEPTQRYKAKGQQFLGFADDVRQKVLEDWKQDIQGSSYQKEVEEGIIQFMEDMMSGKVQIKASKDKTLHSKVYIFRPQGFDADSLGGVMITGSSNLTEQGLGTHHDSNYEFNVELRDYIDVKFATDEFEKLWATAVEVLPADIKNLKKQTFLHDELSPFELYLKFLIEYFGKSVEVDEEVFEVLPRSYTRLQYQADAISEGIKKLEQHNGFILADVVGLGKTIVACAILKKHLIKNAFQSRILVVHPPAVRNAWRKTIRDFKIEPYIELVTNGSLHKIIDNQQTDYSSAEKFDVVVVDESHKFRADNSQMYSYLQLICKTPYQSYSQYTPKKVMLLSATPLNNKPEDIANQIYLFQDARLSTLEGVPNLQTFFAPKFKAYQSVKKEMKDFIVENPTEVLPQEILQKLRNIFTSIKEKVLQPLVIRRTRKDIESNELYRQDLAKQGIIFPQTPETPTELKYLFDDNLADLFAKTVLIIADKEENNTQKLGYYRYRGISHFVDENNANKYAKTNQTTEDIANLFSALMQNRLVKRLESSFFAFKQSLKRLRDQNQYLLDMFAMGKVYFTGKKLPIEKFFADKNGNPLAGKELQANLKTLEQKIKALNSPTVDIYKPQDFDNAWLAGLQKDQVLLNELCQDWAKIDYDPKLEAFIQHLPTLLDAKNVEKKLVIFTESAETASYVAQQLKQHGYTKTMQVSSKTKSHTYKTIQENFDANLDKSLQKNDIDFIVTTDVLAEGINLHRSNAILNYDIPWNATKLMQRMGRVNRIGSTANEILVFNFKPEPKSNAKIQLNEIALLKLQSFHSSFSEQARVYSDLETLEENELQQLDIQKPDEKDIRLEYLTFLRKMKVEQPDLFEKARAIPARSRVARSIVHKPTLPAQTTLAYLRAGARDAFYLQTGKGIIQELTFAEAVQCFEATLAEKGIALQDVYFEHLERMVKAFEDEIYTKKEQEQPNNDHLSQRERIVINKLTEFILARGISPAQKELLQGARDALQRGIFKNLRNDLYQILENKNIKTLVEKLKKVLETIGKYPIQSFRKLDKIRNEQPQHPANEPAKTVLAMFFD